MEAYVVSKQAAGVDERFNVVEKSTVGKLPTFCPPEPVFRPLIRRLRTLTHHATNLDCK